MVEDEVAGDEVAGDEKEEDEKEEDEKVEDKKVEDEKVEDKKLKDETQTVQRNIEKDLFDEQSKILDRFYSLITLSITTLGFTLTAVTFFFGRETPNIREAARSYHVFFTFLCLFMTFLISIINVLAIFHHRKLVKKGNRVEYRKDNELVYNNLKLYLDISRQKNYYVIAISFIALGLTSLFNHFTQHRVVAAALTTGFIVIVLLLIRNTRRYLS